MVEVCQAPALEKVECDLPVCEDLLKPDYVEKCQFRVWVVIFEQEGNSCFS